MLNTKHEHLDISKSDGQLYFLTKFTKINLLWVKRKLAYKRNYDEYY